MSNTEGLLVDLKKSFPDQDRIEIAKDFELIKMTSGAYSKNGITPLDALGTADLARIRSRLEKGGSSEGEDNPFIPDFDDDSNSGDEGSGEGNPFIPD